MPTTLIVQDEGGTIDQANSYVTLEEFKAYHLLRGNSLGSPTPADALIEEAMIRGTDFMDSVFRFIGYRQRPEQRTQWPRTDAEDDDGWIRFGVPDEVKEAASEYGLVALKTPINPTPVLDATGRLVTSHSVTVGPISESYTFAGSALMLPRYPVADKKIMKLVISGGTVRLG